MKSFGFGSTGVCSKIVGFVSASSKTGIMKMNGIWFSFLETLWKISVLNYFSADSQRNINGKNVYSPVYLLRPASFYAIPLSTAFEKVCGENI